MKKIFILTLSLFFLTLATNAQIRFLKGRLQASQEPGDVSSPAGGVVIVKYNMATNVVQVMGNYRNLTANVTVQHIHLGAPGVSGSPVVDLVNTGGTSGGLTVKPGDEVLTDAEEVSLLAGNMYANVHTSTYPAGELRAQLTLTTDGQTELLNARIQGAQEAPPVGSLAMGRANVLIDKAADSVWVTGTFSGLTSISTGAHIHQANPNVSGGILVHLQITRATAGAIDTTSVITAAIETAIIENGTYINIHSDNNKAGEIRGQVTNLHQLMYFANALKGSQENPANNSPARGTFIVRYNPESNLLELWGDYQNLSANISGSHIHGPAPVTENAGIVHHIENTGGTMGVLSLSVTITEEQEAQLLAGQWYTNVHSANDPYKAGEIRGQLLPTTVGYTQFISGVLQASQSVTAPEPPVVSQATGAALVLLDVATNNIFVTAGYTNLTSGIRVSHIHRGAAGANGPVSFDLMVVQGTTSGTVTGSGTITPTLSDSIVNGLSYINIHTVNYPAGEIRAQLGNLVLPLKLKYLNGHKQNNKVVLLWESSQEQNLNYYEVEQQGTDQGEWIKKATVFAKGGNNPAKYTITDQPILNKTSYVIYRLKMVDHDNKFSYSPIIKLNYEKSKGELFIVTNPVINGVLKYNITGFTGDKKAEVSVIDFNGRVVLQKTVSSLMNNNITINHLPSGMYKLMVRVHDTLLQKSFSK